MSISDLKLYALNTTTMVVTFINIESTLKILLLVVSIGYTLQRWYMMNEAKNDAKGKK